MLVVIGLIVLVVIGLIALVVIGLIMLVVIGLIVLVLLFIGIIGSPGSTYSPVLLRISFIQDR